METIKITLTKEDWSTVSTLCETQHLGPYKPHVERWEDRVKEAHEFMRENVTFKYIYNIEYSFDQEITIEIPRDLLRFIIFGVGRIAYALHVKPITAREAHRITSNIENQLVNDEQWQKFRF